MEINHQHVAVKRGLGLQTFVFSEKGQQKISQFLCDWLQVNFLLVDHSLVDSLLDQCLAFAEFFEKLSDKRTSLFVTHVLLGILLAVAPQSQRKLLHSVKLVIFWEIHLGLLQLLVGLCELRLPWQKGQFFSPKTNSLYRKFKHFLRKLLLVF